MRTEYSDKYITMGLKIAYYRKKAGFTQEVLAERIGNQVGEYIDLIRSGKRKKQTEILLM